MKYLRIAEETLEMFFQDINFINDGSRRREVVLPKIAVANCLFKILGPTEIGRMLNIDHSTVLYYFKTHEGRLMYSDYKSLYERAMHAYEFCSKKYKHGDLTHATKLKDKLQDMISEIDFSNSDAIHKMLDEIGNYEKELVINFASMFTSKRIAERNYEVIFS